MLSAVCASAALLVIVPLSAAGPTDIQQGKCKALDNNGVCLVEAIDPARPGGPQDPAGPPSKDRPAQRDSGSSQPSPPSKGSPERSPTAPQQPGGAPDATVGGSRLVLVDEGPAVAAPAVPAPAVLAQRAIESLSLPAPAVGISAVEQAFVGVPLWLWVDAGPTGPVSATASAGAAQVSATGRLVGVEWSMGPPGELVRCGGPGTAWTGQPGASPDCGYTYRQRSLPERTGGSGRWTVTATAVWEVTWSGTSAGAPVTGTEEVRLSASQELAVGEVQVLVSERGAR